MPHNPYAPPVAESIDEPGRQSARCVCPACAARLTHWNLWHMIVGRRCVDCGVRIALEVGGLIRIMFATVSVALLLLLSVLQHWQAQWTSYLPFELFFPSILMVILYLQWRYGSAVAKP